ncbi:MAG: SH3 domain-containing protein [Chloroflexi bacterium]|nr:SH3 domain-containing protein [Chloroflexota bacterium]
MSDDPRRFEPSPDDSEDLYWSEGGDGAPVGSGHDDGDYYESNELYLTGDDDLASTESKPSPWGGRILIIAGVAIVVIVILLLIQSCGARTGGSTEVEPSETVQVVATPQQSAATFTPTAFPDDGTPGSSDSATTPEAPSDSPVSGIFPEGSRVQVANTDNAGMRFRTGPGSTYVTIAILDEGTVLKVVGGPDQADDFIWWRLQADDGTIGWGAQDFLIPSGG